jgi:Amt family ammonium transporter
MPSPQANDIWQVAAALSVLLVLAGHVTLESGLVRAKHSVNAAAKALVQTGITALAIWMIGHGLMGHGGPLSGRGPFAPADPQLAGPLLFDIALACAAATILAGPTAERATLRGHAVAVLVFSAIIFPLVVHWAWAGGPTPGWLAALGYIDLAGAGVVHVTAAAAAIAAAALIGPRIGRFSGNRRLPIIQSQSFPFAVLGALLLWLGWFGIAIGRTAAGGLPLAPVVLNLVLAGAAGTTAAFLANQIWPSRVTIINLIQGTLAGVVAASAGANLFGPWLAVAIGTAGAAAAIGGAWLLERMEIDDALGMASVHLFAGAFGVLATVAAGTMPPAGLVIQGVGLIALVSWAATIMVAALLLARMVMTLRVAPEQERAGLNVSEHRMTTDVALLVSQMGTVNSHSGMFAYLEADADGELGQIAQEYNRAIDIFRAQIRGVKDQLAQTEAAVDEASREAARLAADLAQRDERLEETTREVGLLTDQLARALVTVQSLHGMRDGIVRLIGRSFRQPIERLHIMAKRAGTSRNPADIDALVDAAREESAQLARRLAEVIDYARASTFEAPPTRDRTSIEKLIGEINLIYRPRAETRGVKLRVVWTPDISTMSGSAAVLRKVMGELVARAVDVTPAGGLVSFAARRGPSGELVIDVIDSGGGVSPGQIAAALDPLADTPHGDGDAGLGLALVKKLVDMHGGALTIRSRPGVGTQVRATIHADHVGQAMPAAG